MAFTSLPARCALPGSMQKCARSDCRRRLGAPIDRQSKPQQLHRHGSSRVHDHKRPIMARSNVMLCATIAAHERMTANRLHADAVHRQCTGADRHTRFTQAPIVAIEPGEATGLRIDRDDGHREFDDLIVTRGAGGFRVQESDLHGRRGPMLGLVPCRAGW